MYKQLQKRTGNKIRLGTDLVIQNKNVVKKGIRLVDNRSGALVQGGAGPILRKKMNKVIQMLLATDLNQNNIVKSGSPATYKVDQKYVKKWAGNGATQSQNMLANWDAANAAEVRTPSYKREQFSDTKDWFFWSNGCKGTEFFQHSKSGKETLLKDWIDRKHGDGYLKRLSIMFRNAKMGDPQGFFEDKNNGAFEFMDIQKMGGGQMDGYADYIDQNLIDKKK